MTPLWLRLRLLAHLWALLCAVGLVSPITFAYDGRERLTVVYDTPAKSSVGYDAASIPTTHEKQNGPVGDRVFLATIAEFLAAKTAVHGHHPLPKFLGGDANQFLTKLDPKIHTEFHQLFRQNLKDAGIPLDAANTSSRVWQQYMLANPGAQRTAFDSVLNASRAIDTKHGTQITQDLWKNVMQGNFSPYP